MRDVLHTYSRTQLILISHGSSVNYERSKIIAEIEYDQKKESNVDASQVRSYHRTEEGKYRAGDFDSGPVRKKMSADEYRNFMGVQGLRFRKLNKTGKPKVH